MNLSKLQRFKLFMGAMLALVAAFSILFAVGLPNPAEYSGEIIDGVFVAPEIGAVAPEIKQVTLSGDTVSLSSLRGETLIINFWATWCVPCQSEMPELQSLHEETGIPILAVNIGESQEAIETWVERFGLTFTIVLDPDGLIYTRYRVRGQPSTYIVAPDGIITHIFYGAVSSESLSSALQSQQNNG
jgi:thiol-disulfide isomerase/thioredoxin